MKGQTIVEYILIIGIAITVLYAMGPAFKRGVQSVIKATSDQLATQKDADQDFASGSFLASSNTQTQTNSQRNTRELLGATGTTVDEMARTTGNMLTDMGFSQ
ncbi:MAG: hypothetical protein HY591_01500 [Candidatus Omnitrophica bacterium]|nr:hypothetical protein [Candidatus Omnitrophota bacterium]